jgi:hypothetical protein
MAETITDIHRTQLRDLIAARIHAAQCGCPDWRPDGTDENDDPLYRHTADAVMDLFPTFEV